MIAKLIPLDGSPPIAITQDVTIVGRKRGLCDVYVDHSSVSKIHCVIAKTDGLLFFRDLGSTNGTKVNGQRVSRGALLPGDELYFASVRYRIHLGPGEPDVGPHEHTEMLSALKVPDIGEETRSDEFNIPANAESSGEMDVASDSDVRLLPHDSSAEAIS
ncbi:MAG: FHA domain-containing protein [Planctomycetaceae bacterium]|nr:FHA domain-containing protein [Planctomycetaceae bacterium]